MALNLKRLPDFESIPQGRFWLITDYDQLRMVQWFQVGRTSMRECWISGYGTPPQLTGRVVEARCMPLIPALRVHTWGGGWRVMTKRQLFKRFQHKKNPADRCIGRHRVPAGTRPAGFIS